MGTAGPPCARPCWERGVGASARLGASPARHVGPQRWRWSGGRGASAVLGSSASLEALPAPAAQHSAGVRSVPVPVPVQRGSPAVPISVPVPVPLPMMVPGSASPVWYQCGFSAVRAPVQCQYGAGGSDSVGARPVQCHPGPVKRQRHFCTERIPPPAAAPPPARPSGTLGVRGRCGARWFRRGRPAPASC